MNENDVAYAATSQSADRSLTLLKSFDRSRTELGVVEFARRVTATVATGGRGRA